MMNIQTVALIAWVAFFVIPANNQKTLASYIKAIIALIVGLLIFKEY